VVHLDVQRTFAGSIECCFFEALGEGWMRVTDASDVFCTGAEFHSHNCFRYHVGNTRSYHVNAQYFVGISVGQNFYESIQIHAGARATAGFERETARLVLYTRLFELLFGLPD